MGRFLDLAKAAGATTSMPTSAPSGTLRPPRTPPTVIAIEAKPERLAEVRSAYREAMARLSGLYPPGVQTAWGEIATWPEWVRDIEIAEAAADREALAYQSGAAAKPFTFLAAVTVWETTWADALAATVRAPNVCHGCCQTDATVLVTTGTGRYCPRCLRDDGQAIVGSGRP